MKIVIAIKTMNNAAGGAERVLAFLANALTKRGHSITLLSFDGAAAQSFYPLDDRICWAKLGIGHPNQAATLHETIPRIIGLRTTIKKINPDVVIAFMHSMFIPITFALIGTGIKIIGSEHIVPKHYESKKIEFLLLGLAAIGLETITVLSQSVRALYPKFIQAKMVAMPNPVETNSDLADTVGETKKTKIILTVGRLDPQKDQKTLIDAFSKIAPEFPDWNLRIIGEGTLRKDLEKQIKEYGLGNRITLAGLTKQISTEYLNAHLFVLPSLYESFGMATAEAMSFGLPVIGFSDCPGTNELIVDGYNGVLVKQRNAHALAIEMKNLMTSAEQRKSLGMKGVTSLQKFHPDTIADSWGRLIQTN